MNNFHIEVGLVKSGTGSFIFTKLRFLECSSPELVGSETSRFRDCSFIGQVDLGTCLSNLDNAICQPSKLKLRGDPFTD